MLQLACCCFDTSAVSPILKCIGCSHSLCPSCIYKIICPKPDSQQLHIAAAGCLLGLQPTQQATTALLLPGGGAATAKVGERLGQHLRAPNGARIRESTNLSTTELLKPWISVCPGPAY